VKNFASTRVLVFLAAQLVVVPALLALPLWRRATVQQPLSLPALRNKPLEVVPQYNDPRVVTDAQLTAVLHKLRPRLTGPQPKINHVDHALRMWGNTAEFKQKDALSGAAMQRLLLDDKQFQQSWGETQPPLLLQDATGVGVRTQLGAATASHVDHTLATLAESGVQLDTPIVTRNGKSTVREIATQAFSTLSINQAEYEWTTLALALYAPQRQAWVSGEYQQVTFDVLARRIIRQPLNQGVCFGNHRLYTLAALLQIDSLQRNQQQTGSVPDAAAGILSPAARQQITAHLQDCTRRLTATQAPAGWWDRNWHTGAPLAADQKLDTRARRLLATGHALEWWAIAPAETLPPRETLIRAGQWLATEVSTLDDATTAKNYTFLTHVGRALALWRGTLPADWEAKDEE